MRREFGKLGQFDVLVDGAVEMLLVTTHQYDVALVKIEPPVKVTETASVDVETVPVTILTFAIGTPVGPIRFTAPVEPAAPVGPAGPVAPAAPV